MWTETSFVIREGQDKLARYHQEVSRAKMLGHMSLRSHLAQTLRGWAERLEPELAESATIPELLSRQS